MPQLETKTVLMLFATFILMIVIAHIVAIVRINWELRRLSSLYVQILRNETELSLPKLLAAELIDTLGRPDMRDMVIEIYKNHKKDDWVDLRIKYHNEDEGEKMDDLVAVATDRNFGEVIMRYLL